MDTDIGYFRVAPGVLQFNEKNPLVYCSLLGEASVVGL